MRERRAEFINEPAREGQRAACCSSRRAWRWRSADDPAQGPGRRARHDRRVLRLPVPVLLAREPDAQASSRTPTRDRSGIVFRDFPLAADPSPGRPRPPRPAPAPTSRASSGRCTTRCSPTRRSSRGADLKQHAAALGPRRRRLQPVPGLRQARRRVEEGRRGRREGYGVTSTPAFFVNGRLVVGAQPYEQFAQVDRRGAGARGRPVPAREAQPSVAADRLQADRDRTRPSGELGVQPRRPVELGSAVGERGREAPLVGAATRGRERRRPLVPPRRARGGRAARRSGRGAAGGRLDGARPAGASRAAASSSLTVNAATTAPAAPAAARRQRRPSARVPRRPQPRQRPTRLVHRPSAAVDALTRRRPRLERPGRARRARAAAEIEDGARRRRRRLQRAHDGADEQEVQRARRRARRRRACPRFRGRRRPRASAPLDVQGRQRLQRLADLGEGQGLEMAPLEGVQPGRERGPPPRRSGLSEKGVKSVSRS